MNGRTIDFAKQWIVRNTIVSVHHICWMHIENGMRCFIFILRHVLCIILWYTFTCIYVTYDMHCLCTSIYFASEMFFKIEPNDPNNELAERVCAMRECANLILVYVIIMLTGCFKWKFKLKSVCALRKCIYSFPLK